ncbi:MAG: hypothetical protein DMG32_01710 [Acidobacteria bacterium]|nr:MAG: hypothetical protein DMG32_01710 [Acidobacteriota bacterium]
MTDFEPLKTGLAGLTEVEATLASWRDNDQQAHIVQFYEDDAFLVIEVSRFIGTTLGSGDSGVIIATKAHRDGIAQRLASQGVNTSMATEQGRYVALDAAETLAKFMIGGQPDRERFTQAIGEVIERARNAVGREDARVAAFGEMVALLYYGRKGKRRPPSSWSNCGTLWRTRTPSHCGAPTRLNAFRGVTTASLSLKSARNIPASSPRKATWG